MAQIIFPSNTDAAHPIQRPQAPKERRQDEIGSTHLSVVSVGRWDDYKAALQPKFDLKPTDALGIAVGDAMLHDQRVLDAIATRLGLALPGLSTDGLKVPGDTSTLSFDADAEGARTAASLPGASGIGLGNLSVNPMLRYWAATALYQEVQLLNRYIQDAAYDRTKEDAYLVRLQVTLMPYTRDASYDAWTSLSFFAGDFPWEQSSETQPLPAAVGGASTAANQPHTLTNGARVIPLLVTDDLEALVENQSVDRVRSFSLALSALLGKVGASLSSDQMREQLDQVLGRDLNSLFTVGRFTENTVRCRFGARLQPNGGYAMVPQTHAVTLMVLVPHGHSLEKAIRVVSKTEFRNAKTGKVAEPRTSEDYYVALLKPLGRYGLIAEAAKAVKSRDRESLRKLSKGLANSVADNDFGAFTNAVFKLVTNRPPSVVIYYESLWADVASVRAGNNFSSAVFRLPEAKVPEMFANQVLVLKDDGKAQSTMVLNGKNLSPETLKVRLGFTNSLNVLHAVGAAASADGTSLTVRFASLKGIGLSQTNDPPIGIDVITQVAGGAVVPIKLHKLITESETRSLAFKAKVTARTVLATKGVGRLSLIVSETQGQKPRVNFEGADVRKTEGGPVGLTDKGWELTGDGQFWFTLENLTPGPPLRMIVSDTNSVSNTFELPVTVYQDDE